MKLRIEDKDRYLEQVYAAWLGKVIGVRLGSPVENWSHEKIMEAFPDEEGYLVDYDVYAADDDLNGPLFFVRALLEEGELSAEKIGDTFLNYLQEYRGFFWWGGVGISSEHTAYENLKKGIPAPKSGSAEVNGLTMAEQIGGQIFSDCWGYVAGYDPDLAKQMAQMASSVTHDRNGIQGGIFVAVAITLAMMKEDIHEVIDEALEYLDKDMEYYQTARDIIRFYEENRNDWTLCLKYIQDNYGYDRYPGVCHIIPNMALMIMAMCYGENDFDRTLVMLNRCGWDTDCNCGNVG
ncbi:MAG: ADP-ribosylglycohydrolase family protein, partial [Erysipelotrichaceae bacterium]|nr:ADP-ribosylglycohydrolase family protein [Erysipelotrichaceae bacterium]